MTHPLANGPVCGDAGGIKKDGTPCRMFLNLGDSGLCWAHDPARKDEARGIRSAGAIAAAAAKKEERARKAGEPPAPMKDLHTALLWVSWAAEELRCGAITDKEAAAHTRAAQVYIAGAKERDIEKQLKVAQAKLEDRRKGLRAV